MTDKKRDRWDLPITIDNELTTPTEWVGKNYLVYSDRNLAKILRGAGFKISASGVVHKRRDLGLPKGRGKSPKRDMTGEEWETLDTRILRMIKNRPMSLVDIANGLDQSPKTIGEALDRLIAQDYNVIRTALGAVLDTKMVSALQMEKAPPTVADELGMWVKWGVMSDLHGGSKFEQITHKISFAQTAYNNGVRHILVPGDLFAGHNVYRGQVHELYAVGADAQVAVLTHSLPRHPGLIYHVIGGNHDKSIIRLTGHNPVAAFARGREDVIYYGFHVGDVHLTKDIDIRLWHPRGGIPYARSYRLDKGMEKVATEMLMELISCQKEEDALSGPRVRFILCGHLHTALSIPEAIYGLMCGCWEGQTSFLAEKQLFPQIGGWIISAYITESGWLHRIKTEWISYPEISDDYLNYPDLMAIAENVPMLTDDYGALFEWKPTEIAEA